MFRDAQQLSHRIRPIDLQSPGNYMRGNPLGDVFENPFDCSENLSAELVNDLLERGKHIVNFQEGTIADNDVVLGIESSGCHLEGFLIIRECLKRVKLKMHDLAPWEDSRASVAESLLVPSARIRRGIGIFHRRYKIHKTYFPRWAPQKFGNFDFEDREIFENNLWFRFLSEKSENAQTFPMDRVHGTNSRKRNV